MQGWIQDKGGVRVDLEQGQSEGGFGMRKVRLSDSSKATKRV